MCDWFGIVLASSACLGLVFTPSGLSCPPLFGMPPSLGHAPLCSACFTLVCLHPLIGTAALSTLPTPQGFNWESSKESWYKKLAGQATEIADAGFTAIWFPPASDSVSPQVKGGAALAGLLDGWCRSILVAFVGAAPQSGSARLRLDAATVA